MKSFISKQVFAASLSIAVLPLLLAPAAFGQITFGPPVNADQGTVVVAGSTKPVALVNPTSVAVGLFDADPNPDMVVLNGLPIKNGASYEFYLSFFKGNGDGTFTAPVRTVIATCPASAPITRCSQPIFILAAKFGGHANLDLAVLYSGTTNPDAVGSVSILAGNNDGTFTHTLCNGATDCPVGLKPFSMTAGLFDNGDSNLDLAVANRGDKPGTVSILMGNPDGTFDAAVSVPVGLNPVAIAVDDFDGDLKMDLAVANFGDNNVSLLKGDGLGGFTPFPAPTVPGGNEPIALVTGDFNQDGKRDLAVAGQSSKLVTILLGNNDGTFPKSKKVTVGKVPIALRAGDFNGDHVIDLATAQFPGHTIGVFAGVGDGTFSKPVTLKSTGGGVGNFDLAVADFDNDGQPDLAAPNGKISVFLNTTIFPAIGAHVTVTSPNGGESFPLKSSPTVSWTSAGFNGTVAIDLSTDSGATWKNVAKNVPNSNGGSAPVKISTKATTTARVRVCSVLYPGICDGSDADFTIQ